MICKSCGEIVRDDEETLWGHIQLWHDYDFAKVQDWETPEMVKECYYESEKEQLLDNLSNTLDDGMYALRDKRTPQEDELFETMASLKDALDYYLG